MTPVCGECKYFANGICAASGRSMEEEDASPYCGSYKPSKCTELTSELLDILKNGGLIQQESTAQQCRSGKNYCAFYTFHGINFNDKYCLYYDIDEFKNPNNCIAYRHFDTYMNSGAKNIEEYIKMVKTEIKHATLVELNSRIPPGFKPTPIQAVKEERKEREKTCPEDFMEVSRRDERI